MISVERDEVACRSLRDVAMALESKYLASDRYYNTTGGFTSKVNCARYLHGNKPNL